MENKIFCPYSVNFLKSLLREKNIFLSKSRGQNFLIDRNIAQKIVSSIPENQTILEVGPGLGALTFLLIENHRVYAVEIDKKIYTELKNHIENKNLILINGDFLKFNLSKIPEKRLYFVSNLPYSISGEALKKFIDEEMLNEGILMLQKEFVEKMLATFSTENYCVMSIITYFFLEIEKLFDVSKNCFFPAPEVDSTVIRIKKKKSRYNHKEFGNFLKKAFSQRRKTILNNLKNLNISPEVLEKLEIPESTRPENIHPEKWAILFEYYQAHKSQEE